MRLTQNRWIAPLILAGVMLVQIVTHLAWLPISTQVGQMAIPWLMSRGMTIYGSLIENRPPATAALISLLIRLLPAVEPILIVRMLNLVLVLALTLLIYGLARRLGQSVVAGICTVLVWFLWEPVYGNILFYFDALVGATFALTVFVWLVAEDRQPGWIAPFLCGLLLGGATLFKQPAWAGVILFALWLIFVARRGRQLPAFVVGVLIFPLATIGIFAAQGTLDSYLFWTYTRAFARIGGGEALSGNTLRKFGLTDMLAPAFLLLSFRQEQAQSRRWLLVFALWLAGGATLLPNFSEIYVMGHLPLLAVMSGMVIAALIDFSLLSAPLRWLRQANTTALVLAGLALALTVGWLWTIAATYAPGPLGRAGIPAYDEFKPLAARIEAIRQPGDTLFILPMSDGNPQLYVLTGMLPPGLWMNSHPSFLSVPGESDKQLADWALHPPDLMVDFPQERPQFEPGIIPLAQFMMAHYHKVDQLDDVPFNGDAIIYRYGSP